MIEPRPFLVEHGHFDSITYTERVAYDFAKVKRTYQLLGVGDRAVLDTHTAGHDFHGDTSLPFIHRHLHHPEPATR